MNKIFRGIKLNENKCRGCTQCMNKCPMEAIRLRNGKAVIYEDKCIDCGRCIEACVYNAYEAERNSLEELKDFKVTIAVPTVAIYSQFGDYINPLILRESIKDLGFDEVFDITYAADIATEIMKKEIDKVSIPAVSISCPCIEKLIKASYPGLTEHVVRVITPIEISASIIRDTYMEKGYKEEEIGVFYISTCVAWKATIDMNKNDNKSKIDGIIPLSDIYLRLLNNIKSLEKDNDRGELCDLSYTGLSWSYPGGLSKSLNLVDYLAVDGIENVTKVFEEVMKGRLKGVKFIEGHACPGGCLGGNFLIENPYNAKRITKKYYDKINRTYGVEDISDHYRNEFVKNQRYYNNNDKLAEDFIGAVKRMKRMNEIINVLPGIDCGLCGSPTCKVFAEDVVRGLADISACKMIERGEK